MLVFLNNLKLVHTYMIILYYVLSIHLYFILKLVCLLSVIEIINYLQQVKINKNTNFFC